MFHLLLSGQCQLHMNKGPALNLHAGDFVLLPQGDPHTLRDAHSTTLRPLPVVWQSATAGSLPMRCNTASPGPDDMDLLCGHFGYSEGAGSLLVKMLPPFLRVNLHEIDSLRSLVAMLRQEVIHQRAGGLAIINALGQALFALALRAWSLERHAPASVLTLAADARLGPSIQAMMRAPGTLWTIERLGALVGMSRATYARHFRKHADIGVAEFLQGIRMMHACELLRHTRRGLDDIAQAVGYRSEASFGKIFRQSLGQSPGKWRKSQMAAVRLD